MLRIAHWNIEGLHNQKSDEKLKTADPDFIGHINSKSIIFISETHIGEETTFTVPCYLVHSFTRKKHPKARRFSGGIAILVKEDITKGVKVLPNTSKSPDLVWLKLDSKFFGLSCDIYIGAIYASPKNSTYTQRMEVNVFDLLHEDISSFSKQGKVIVMGDFNARTGTEPDYIVDDDDQYCDLYDDYVVDCDNDLLLPRKNRDEKVNGYGKELLDLCWTTGIRIANGRCLGDLEGSFTCHQYNGSSTVDYALIQKDIMSDVMFFRVHEFKCTISDHCMISIGLNIQYNVTASNVMVNLCNFDNKFKWHKKNEQVFKRVCATDAARLELNRIRELCQQDNIKEGVVALNRFIIMHANKICGRIKYKKPRKKRWYNTNCRNLKSNLTFLGVRLQNDPNNCYLRGLVFTKMKQYKKIIKAEKRKYKDILLNKILNLKDKNPKSYWKLVKELRSLECNSKDDTPNIDATDWLKYYQQLLNENDVSSWDEEIIDKLNELELDKCFSELDFRVNESEIVQAIKRF